MDKKKVVFDDFLKHKKKAQYSHNKKNDTKQLVQSTYCSVTVPSWKLANTPGQKSRIKPTKTKVKFTS